MDLIALAGPLFIVMIVAEILLGIVRKKTHYYRLNDTIAAISTGIVSRTTRLVGLGFATYIYAVIIERFSLSTWSSDSIWVWILAFVTYDFFYYWAHRFGHEINIFWAAHVVHHQGEEFNLSTALRQTSSGFLLYWIFFIPWFVMGFPPEMFITVGSLNLIYQFWVHTRHVDKLGPIEWIFITPSNHRVHHAQNSVYIDKNYGGVFIVWDRLFGTFQEELDHEPPVYGIRKPLSSWNPFWANFSVYASLWRDAIHTQSLKDKFLIWFKPTGWRPADVAQRFPQPKADLEHFKKYDTAVTLTLGIYCAAHFVVILAVSALLLLNANNLAPLSLWLSCGFVWMTLYSLAVLLEGRTFSMATEALRLLMIAFIGFGMTSPLHTLISAQFILGYLVVSGVGLFILNYNDLFKHRTLPN